jgi:uncharacterized delta-60 repeat protein
MVQKRKHFTFLLAVALATLICLPTQVYAAAGDLDTTFGTGGKVITDFPETDDEAFAVAIQPDGKIVVAGPTVVDGAVDFGLARYKLDGSLDVSFGTGGKVTTDFSGSQSIATAVAIQRDGKIVVAGLTDAGGVPDFALARYNPDGSLDPTFGTGGQVTTDFSGGNDQAFGVAIQSDGKIVVAGVATIDFALVRYNPDGSLDTRFGTGGKVTTDFSGDSDHAHGVAIQPDGKIVVAGTAGFAEFALARYNTDGTLDTGFRTDGKLTTDFSGGIEQAHGVAIQPDGKIVVVGVAGEDFALARYNGDGTLDTSFSSDGKVITESQAPVRRLA